MSKTSYNIHLKGYVGGADFDRNAVDAMLAQNDGKAVNVLIDSLGGSLATGLSISAAFKQHGNVAVHFVGLNASAATIASLGAAHISIDAGAMYLVHQCSMAFFEWGSLNSDQFATFISIEMASRLGIPFYEDLAECPSKHRVGAVFTLAKAPPTERNVIVFDDFVTTGATMISMRNLLSPLGYNLVFFTGINNKR